MTKRTEELIFNAEKKHSIRYDAKSPHDDETCIKSIYITRSGLKALTKTTSYPGTLKLTIEFDDLG